MQNQSANIYKLFTMLWDAVLLIGLFVLVGWWRFEDLRISNPEYYNYYLQLWVLTGISWYAVGQSSGIFAYSAGLEQRNVVASVLRSAVSQFAVLAIIVVGLKGYYYSRIFLAAYFAGFYLLALVGRLVFVYYLRAQLVRGRWQQKILLVGQNQTLSALGKLLENRVDMGWTVVGYFDDAHAVHAFTGDFDGVFCAWPPGSPAYDALKTMAEHRGKRFRYVPEMGQHYAGQLAMESIDGIPVFSQREEPLGIWRNALVKRMSDVVLSLVLILCFLSWMLPLFALLLFLSGAGQPMFRQERVGYQGRAFTVLKFRSINAQTGRSNGLQRWMRKVGLDELPQLWNVLKGQMSLVGPRPHTLEDHVLYGSMVESYGIRHWTKPGMTGLAQIRGLRGGGEAASKDLLDERIRADVYYVENWSVLMDVRILIETAVRTLLVPSSLHTKR
ncbi:MAG: hypothetical protein RL754_994 [Bacteroidota bacterium]|jgi:lipopolysaccharide/colanic/teichoic acid biosynthesis glycosyltransferase